MITEKTFDIAKWLLGCGVETSYIHNLVFNSEPIEKINLIKEYSLSGGFVWELMRDNPQGYVTVNSLIRIM